MKTVEAIIVKSSEWVDPDTLRSKSTVVRVVFILLVAVIIIYIGSVKYKSNFPIRQKIHSHSNSTAFVYQNKSFVPPRQFDVVLSYYSEDVNYVARYIRYLRGIFTLKNIQSRIIVYNKNSQKNDTHLKEVLKADIVQSLVNLGREGGTYLYHIIANYDKLANHIVFSQAGVEGMNENGLDDWYLHRLEKQFNSSVGYMPLVANREVSIYDCGRHASGNFQRLAELWGILQQTLCPLGGQAVAFRGQFLVSAKRIHIRPLHVYKYLNEFITANSTHWIHSDPFSPPNWPSSPENPVFGHVMERLWTVLFNCTNPDLHERCVRNECACFDSQ